MKHQAYIYRSTHRNTVIKHLKKCDTLLLCGPPIISKLWLALHPIRLTCPASNHKTCWAIFWASMDRNGGTWLTYDHVSPSDFAQIGPSLEKFRRFGIATSKHSPLRRNRGTALVHCLYHLPIGCSKGKPSLHPPASGKRTCMPPNPNISQPFPDHHSSYIPCQIP